MRLQLIAVSALALAVAVPAAAQPPRDRTADQIVCDLTGQCGDQRTEPVTKLKSGKEAAYSFRLPAGGGKAKPPAPATARYAMRPQGRIGASNMNVSFATGSAVLTPVGEAQVRSMANALGQPGLAARRVRIEGHTDAVGTRDRNLTLSRQRADAVAAYLIARGTAVDRIDTDGFAADRPLVKGNPYAAANRRVQLVLLD